MDHEALLRDLYAAFNARDVDAVIARLHPDVDWPYSFRDGLIVRMDVIEPREEDRPRARPRRPRA